MSEGNDNKYSSRGDGPNGPADVIARLREENVELKKALAARQHELDLLYTLFRKVNITMHWDEIEEIAVELIMDFFPVVKFCLIAVFGERNDLMLRMKKEGEQVAHDRIWAGFEIDDATTWDTIVSSEEWNRYFDNLEHVKMLQSSFIPLSFRDRQLGFLMLGSDRETDYGQDEWRILSTTAGYIGTVLDNSRLYELNRTDPLTGLFNRRFFNQRLRREIARAFRRDEPLTMFMIDIDHFKQVNDTHGHPAGDQVLIELSGRLQSFAWETEQVFRIGGEEFVLLSPGTSKEAALQRGENLRLSIANKPFQYVCDDGNVTRDLTISIGISVYPDDATDISKLISKSDQALYNAKSSGRNLVALA